MRGYASLLAARRMLSSGACVAVLCLGGCEWPIFLSLRWHLAAALATDPAPLAAAVVAARQAFENREAEGQAEGEAGGEAEGALLFARLCALDPSAEAADYQPTAASEAWDLQGLRSDIELVEEAMAPWPGAQAEQTRDTI